MLKVQNSIILLVILVSLLVTLYSQLPLLRNEYAINDDVRHAVYFFAKYQDSGLFNNDFITDYYSRWSPYGLNAVYFLISRFFDPIKATKFLPFILCAVSAFYIFKAGAFIKNNIAGFIASIMFILVSWSREVFESFATADAESFGILFCTMFLYYYLKNNKINMCCVLILMSLFYAPLLLVCLLVVLFEIFSITREGKLIVKENTTIFVTIFAIAFILVFQYFNKRITLISLPQMKGMAEFFPGGRTPVFFPSFYERWTNYQSGLALDYPIKILLLFSVALFLLQKGKFFMIPRQFWYFITSSLILFILSNIFLFKFYGPSRYVRHPLSIFLIFLVSLNCVSFTEKLKMACARRVALVGLFAVISFFYIPHLKQYYVIAPHKKLYAFLQTLPKNILVAGHPALMDNVPTFAKRSVFVNEESSEPYYADYYEVIKKRTYAFFEAYYSDSVDKIINFCRTQGIIYMVIDKQHFSEGYLKKGNFYFNPFNQYISDLVKTRKKGFAVEKLYERRIFEDGDIFVVGLRN